MRQILYVSECIARADQAVLQAILERSRHNNALDGVTGLLWSDGDRFAQVIEGDERAIEDTMARIQNDPRHHRIAVLHDRRIEQRQFGEWSMEVRESGEAVDAYDTRLRRALDNASDAIRNVFASLVTPTAV